MSFDLRTVTRSYQIINEIGTSDSYYAVTLARDICIIGVRRLFISILHLFLLLLKIFIPIKSSIACVVCNKKKRRTNESKILKIKIKMISRLISN